MEEVQVPKVPVPLYSVAGLPFLGMVSAMDSAAIPEGTWSFAQNVRWADGTIRIRGGLTEYRAKGNLPTGTVVGAFCDRDSGDYVAINTGSNVDVYKFVDDGATGWFKISATTMTAASRFVFEKITIPSPGATLDALGTSLGDWSFIVVQNGIDAPRTCPIVALTSAASLSTISQTVTLPNPSKTRAVPMAFGYLSVIGGMTFTNSAASTTTGGSTGTVTVASAYTSPAGTTYAATTAPCINILTSTSTAAGDNIKISFSNSVSFATTQASQIQIIHNGADQYMWDSWRLEIGTSGGTYYVVHDPTITDVQSASAGGDRYIASLFDCSSVATSVATSSFIAFPAITVDRIRLTYTGSAAAAKTIPIYGIAFGTNVPFGTQFGVTFYEPSTGRESPPAVAANQSPPTLRSIAGTPLPGVTLAGVPGAKYRYQITTPEVTAGQRAITYAREGNSKTYYCLDLLTSGSNTTTPGKMLYWNVDTLTFGKWVMPPATTIPIPIAGPMCLSGDRLFVGRVNGTGSLAKRNTVAFSEKRFPNRFNLVAEVIDGQVQPRSGGTAMFGAETVTAIAPQAGAVSSGSAVFVWTEQRVGQMAGVDAIQLGKFNDLGPYGTTSPGSVVRFRDSTVWLTPSRELMALSDGISDISGRLIEDVLAGIPEGRLDDVEGQVIRGKLYMGYTPSGGTKNTNALVFDYRTSGWSVDSINTLSNATFCKSAKKLVGNEERNLWFDTTGWMFEYDVLTGTGTSGDRYVTATTIVQPTLKLTSRTLTKGFTQRSRFGDIMLVADSQGDGVVWDTTLIERQTGTSYAGKINMDGDASKLWRYNRGTTETERVGSIGLGNQVQIEGQGLPNSAIYAISVDNEGETLDGADRA